MRVPDGLFHDSGDHRTVVEFGKLVIFVDELGYGFPGGVHLTRDIGYRLPSLQCDKQVWLMPLGKPVRASYAPSTAFSPSRARAMRNNSRFFHLNWSMMAMLNFIDCRLEMFIPR